MGARKSQAHQSGSHPTTTLPGLRPSGHRQPRNGRRLSERQPASSCVSVLSDRGAGALCPHLSPAVGLRRGMTGRGAGRLLALPACLAAMLLLLAGGAAAAGECGRAQCGMGSCAESDDYTFGFACQCRPGWSRYHLGGMQFTYLPCVIPNCTITNNCQDGSSPPPAPPPPLPPPPPPFTNSSIFDPCLMQYCGDGGACEKASDFTHRCRCRDGYANLLNDTTYPCYRQCSLGSDCRDLGIGVINGSTPTSAPPAPFSFTVRKSGAGAAAKPAERLLELLALMSFLWLQAI